MGQTARHLAAKCGLTTLKLCFHFNSTLTYVRRSAPTSRGVLRMSGRAERSCSAESFFEYLEQYAQCVPSSRKKHSGHCFSTCLQTCGENICGLAEGARTKSWGTASLRQCQAMCAASLHRTCGMLQTSHDPVDGHVPLSQTLLFGLRHFGACGNV